VRGTGLLSTVTDLREHTGGVASGV
jgi:hypothetical protein